jgi:hypothetical protein
MVAPFKPVAEKGLAPSRDETTAYEPPAVERPPMRQSFEDHFARAAARIAVLRGHFTDGVVDDSTDEFHIPKSDIPEGWDYQWKRQSLLGKEDPTYEVMLARTGWEAVPLSRHPHYMPEGYVGTTILRRGMLLMERPLEITLEVRRMENKRARNQVRIREQQLTQAPAGQFERDNEGSSLASVKKGYAPIVVPEV